MINLDIDKLSKTAEGMEQIAKAFANISANPKYREEQRVAWQYYYGKQSDSHYDYLIKDGDFTLPVLPKFFPIQRGYINLLVSTFYFRPFVYSLNACNRDAVKQKYENRMKGLIGEMMNRAKLKRATISGSIESMQMQMSQLQQMVQQQPKNEQQAAMIEQLQMVLPQLKAQIIGAMDTAKTEELFTRTEIEKTERYYTYEKKELYEEIAQKAAKKLRNTFGMREKGKKAFVIKNVAGTTYFMVDYDSERNKLIYEVINPLKVTYPDTENVDWVQNGSWVKIEENMSPDSIISTWGHKLRKEQIEAIRKMKPSGFDTSGKSFLALPGGAVLDIEMSSDKDSTIKTTGSGTNVQRIWWIAQKEITAVQSPNEHRKNDHFTHFIPDDRILISAKDYRYNSSEKVYVNKKNKEEKIEKDRVIVLKDADKVIKRYVDYRYRAVVINNGEIVIAEKDPVQPRSNDNYSRVPLPVVGPTHNGIADLPYSLIMMTKGLADTYNLLHVHREIILALSGVAGILIDMSQKPEGMPKEEWFHNMKMGRMLIQTVKDGKQISSFNQFNRFDMSFSASIQYIDGMIQQTDMAIGDIIGISPPRKGDVRPQDQVGTQQQSKIQSELRTEVYFIDYEEIERQAFSALVNLYAKYIASKGDIIELVGEDLSYEYFEIPEGMFDELDLSVNLSNSRKQEDALQEIKMISKQYADQNRLPFHAWINMYFAESIVEIKKMAEYYDRNMQESMSKMQQDSQQANAQAMQQVEQMKAELQMKLKELEVQLKDKEMELKSGIEQTKTALEQEKMKFEREKWNDQKNLQLLEIVNQDKIESTLLQENQQARKADQQIKLIQTKLDALFNMVQLELQGKEGADRHIEALKKIKVDDKKASRKMVKEHVSDN